MQQKSMTFRGRGYWMEARCQRISQRLTDKIQRRFICHNSVSLFSNMHDMINSSHQNGHSSTRRPPAAVMACRSANPSGRMHRRYSYPFRSIHAKAFLAATSFASALERQSKLCPANCPFMNTRQVHRGLCSVSPGCLWGS